MPRRPKSGKGKRGKKGGKRQSSTNDIDTNALSLQSTSNNPSAADVDLNRLGNMEISDVASLVKSKLAELEETKKRKEYQSMFAAPHALTAELREIQSAFYSEMGINPPPQPLTESSDEKTAELTELDNIDADTATDEPTITPTETTAETTTETTTEATTEATTTETTEKTQSVSPQMEKALEYFNKLSGMVERADNLIYTLVDNEKSVRQTTDRVLTQNQTMQQLCRRLQTEKSLLTTKIEEIQKREKDWHDSVQKKFQQSLDDIRIKISEHESRYNAVVKENGELHRKIEEYLSYDKRRTVDFEQYKEHCSKLEEIHEAEKSNLRSIVTQSKNQITQLTTNLQEALKINTILKAKNNEYEDKFTSMSQTLQDSTQCMDQFKSMKSNVLKQNKELRKQIKDLMSKYTQLNTYNELLQKAHEQSKVKSDALEGKVDTLSQLCRKLQHRNRELQSGNVSAVDNTVIPSAQHTTNDITNSNTSPIVMSDDTLIADATDDSATEKVDTTAMIASQSTENSNNEVIIAPNDGNIESSNITTDDSVDDDEADMPDLELLKPPSDTQPTANDGANDATVSVIDIMASIGDVTNIESNEDNSGAIDTKTDENVVESNADEAQTF